ncbi:restriction endonuclease subunit S [Streptomyces sp. 135]|uniref:restriction endonuclease subunit S n=1 Tax=Streptomyces sp. 135 TaxID=2838850 RepID=UPI001CBFBDD2|nr:restriction endonuclease subunit S [Streptomyces sp. 135]
MTKWPTVPIGHVTRAIGGGTPTRSNPEFYGGDIPWVTPKDMKRWKISDSQVRITKPGLENSTARLAPAHSVLVVVRSGVLKHTVPVAISERPVAINQDMKALICSEDLDPNYLAYFIKERSSTILQWVRATTADNFPIGNLMNFHIPLPPVSEQRRVVRILDHVEALRGKRREAVELLSDLRQSIFAEMFGNRVEISQKWPQKHLGEMLEFLTSGSRGWAAHYTDNPGSLFLRIQNVRDGELLMDDVAYVIPPDTAEARRTRVQSGDVLLSITADLGRTAVIPDGLGEAFINQHLSILRSSKLNPHFLSAFLESPLGRERILGRNRQAVKAGLNFDDVRSLNVPCPPMQFQEEFERRIARGRELQGSHIAHLDALDSLFASLRNRTFRSELPSGDLPRAT